MCTYALMLHQCTRCKYVQPATRATILQPCPNEARCVTATPISEVRNDVLCERHGAVDPATNWCWAVRRNKPAAARERGRRDAREWWESCEREWDERWGGRAGGW
ncbi:uncharacterized protein THITE_2088038 [Thermothielavioides terrestris NRRL 8126]|uniref:Uncharacterized protein n=1 Tax=Thermothielavioides terrestris (strain ATCC 38088 / NRRL 8126) TaxID=578455 RepID=G2R1L6_THETT|nr:uncharacterized protein THITE_2088038 [Thermothielavioides terrestris NRRL 8126]AEO66558.1 hypothetical protein THITE_2088038 [Thermothielavioides terrestris NRRL 8126]